MFHASCFMFMYDTHCHLNFKAFAEDYYTITKKSIDAGMLLNIVGTQYETSKRAVAIANEFADSSVYAAVGLHPTHLNKNDVVHKWDYEKYRELAFQPKVVAIGETGIDHFHDTENVNKQQEIFEEHIKLARELGRPLIIHCRPSHNSFDAYNDLLAILKNTPKPINGVVHCFLGNRDLAEQFLELGAYLSFTGIITFKNADASLLETVKNIPLDKIMIETDAPYLAPEPFRGKTNYPYYVEYVARKIGEVKNISVGEVIKTTEKNGKLLFLNKF